MSKKTEQLVTNIEEAERREEKVGRPRWAGISLCYNSQHLTGSVHCRRQRLEEAHELKAELDRVKQAEQEHVHWIEELEDKLKSRVCTIQ